MNAKAFSRWQAAGAHLVICIVIAAAMVAAMFAVWFPGPLYEAAGRTGPIFVLAGVVLGPLLTLVVFKSGKRGMKFDLAVIGTVQVLALFFAVHVVSLARPAFIVFVNDRFELATAGELDPAELAAAKYPQFRSVPWTGPLWAAADMPADPAERNKVVLAAVAGMDMQSFPRLYVPYADRSNDVLAKALSVARLRATEPVVAKAVDRYLASSGTREAQVRCLLLRTRYAWLAVLIDPNTAQPLKLVLGERVG